ncbi:S8 family serine peptidase [Actimicrobium antarcticum]|uniref:Peptidase inhibitor I9 n=1 Tax=Actimicrobium antarcticum TaxID=1051899 RepID=A0ABP7TSN9_9BURK
MNLRLAPWAALMLVSGLSATAHAQEARHPYIIQLVDKPAASYTGEVSGLKATQPAAGKQLNVGAADVQAYISYLDQKQSTVLATVGAANVTHQYTVVFNGFSAMLTDTQVRQLKKNSGVANITVDEARQMLTNYTPTFLGLDKVPGGIWERAGGKGAAGEGMVIGIVDGGIWPENAAFADRVDANGVPTFDPSGTLAYGAAPAGWTGLCESGEGFTAANCNNKLIGARFFNKSFKSTGLPIHWSDFVSPRDQSGHGTHTSSTAGGNNGVPATAGGIPMGKVSGIAPRARVAMYKVCWTYPDPAIPGAGKNSCFNGDSVAAIEQATKDGVNVINYSISGSQTSVTDPVELAFLGAANAGIFVAASAGNSGPANQVAHISPWLTTVAASTHDRLNGATVTLGNGASYLGASLNVSALPATALILSTDAGLPDASPSLLRLCYGASDGNTVLDPAKVAGKIVVCTRGTTARVNKSLAVKEAGGVGMVLLDNGAGLVAEVHAVPTVHLLVSDANAVRSYAVAAVAATQAKSPDATPLSYAVASVAIPTGPTAALSVFTSTKGTTPAPVMADFSSRGPNQGNLNVLKPDLTAPGVDILAGVTPPQTPAERDAIANGSVVPAPDWAFYQGTSMSSPHVAGLAALLKQQNPTWSPAAIKSALMTTGATTFNDGKAGLANGRLPWAQGAGHVTPNLAANPGLVYDMTPLDHYRFLCGINTPGLSSAFCASIGPVQAYNLNLPSLTASNVLGKITLTRAVTNVGATASTYSATASVPGFTTVVSPSTLSLAKGATAQFSVTLTRTDAAADVWQYGSLEWNDGVHKVRSPLTAKPSLLAAPLTLFSEAATGSKIYTIGTGFAGAMSSIKGGLKAATRSTDTVGANSSADGGVAECKAGGSSSVKAVTVTVPAGALAARFALYDEDTSGYKGGSFDDLDLLVIDSAGQSVGSSGGATASEMVQLANPAAGTYRVCVIGYAPAFDELSTFTLSTWVVTPADAAGAFKVMFPGTAYLGGTATVGMSWSALAPSTRYLGAVRYMIAGVPQATTTILVETTDPLPPTTAQRSVSSAGATPQ